MSDEEKDRLQTPAPEWRRREEPAPTSPAEGDVVLQVRWNTEPGTDACAVCGATVERQLGPELFVVGAGRRVACLDCGRRLAPPFVDWLERQRRRMSGPFSRP